jgi:hypothetical protein
VRLATIAAVAGAALTASLGGCGQASDEEDARTCYVASGEGFSPLDTDIPNLETCAARLEVVYLRHPTPVRGRYGGVFVYVDAADIAAAAPNGPRVRLLDAKSRGAIDADIRQLLKAAG